MTISVLFCGTGWFAVIGAIERALHAAGVAATVRSRDLARPLALELADIDVALPSNARFGPEEIAAAPRLRLIQQPAVGFEGIDLGAARTRRIPVCNAPGTNTDAVAQAALLLILALARRLPRARRTFAEREIGAPAGIELTGRTLGIVGLGRTGSRLADAARAIGMTVLGVQSRDDRGALLAMLRRADVVSIHCPLTPRTRGLFDEEAFAALRPGALLVNVARGPIVDRGALLRALASERLGGVGLDVIALPHVAGSTEEAFARIAAIVAHNVRAVVAGEPLIHRVDGG